MLAHKIWKKHRALKLSSHEFRTVTQFHKNSIKLKLETPEKFLWTFDSILIRKNFAVDISRHLCKKWNIDFVSFYRRPYFRKPKQTDRIKNSKKENVYIDSMQNTLRKQIESKLKLIKIGKNTYLWASAQMWLLFGETATWF